MHHFGVFTQHILVGSWSAAAISVSIREKPLARSLDKALDGSKRLVNTGKTLSPEIFFHCSRKEKAVWR
jgi:hypothetical protein